MKRRTRLRGDGGALSLFVAISAVAMLTIVGLVVDGGARLRAIENADALAQEAARAGGEQIDQAAALQGTLKVDPVAAASAAQAYLTQNNIPCSGCVQTTDTTVTVDVTTDYQTLLLGIVGLGTLSVHGHGSAVLVGPNGVVNQGGNGP